MVRRFLPVFRVLALLGYGVVACAQDPHIASVRGDSAAQVIALGQSSAPLNGPWKFRVGDSPIDPATHTYLWAEPDFDDSGWEQVDLTPKPGVVDPWNGDPRWVPGWTERGHPGYMGWAWYRVRVRVAVNRGESLAVNAPLQADDAYQLFANGEQIGSLGRFNPQGHIVATYFPSPQTFVVPPAFTSADRADEATHTFVFAYRTWMGPLSVISGIAPGGLHYAPILLSSQSKEAQYRSDRVEWILAGIYPCFGGAAFLLLAILAISLVLFDRSDPVYLWVAGALMVTVLQDLATAVMNYTQLMSADNFFLLYDVVLGPLLMGMWAMVWWVWFRLRRPRWMPMVIATGVVVNLATQWMARWYFATYQPRTLWTPFQVVNAAAGIAFVLLVLLILWLGIRHEGREGWLAVPAVLALSFNLVPGALLEAVGVNFVFHPFGISFFLDYFTGLLLAAAIGLLMLRRLLLSLKRQRQMALDVKQAQEVQQVILPEAHMAFPGLEIETDYRPAREVGGDFFQIVPGKTDGSVLIVAGDVTGKGLKAGMLVALLVGAIRSTAETSSDPLVILQALNRRLIGRGDAQATCLALRVETDGRVTLANAGHLAPYLNRELLQMEGALPLGMIEEADFSMMTFKLNEGDQLMLMSDGIPEATNANGDLFGFERIHELLRSGQTATSVAAAAQSFGQEDDISVICVSRTRVPVSPGVGTLEKAGLSA